MRRKVLGVLILAAVLLGVLAAGTPVNNDPSQAASVAGIHLTASPSRAPATSAAPAPLLAFLTLLALGSLLLPVSTDRSRRRTTRPLRTLRLASTGGTRGPPVGR